MGYYINLKSITLDDYHQILAGADILKSRKILKESISERLGVFKTMGITNLFELQQWLKKKSNWAAITNNDLLTEEYLTILLREINSINPKTNKFADFPGIKPQVVSRLTELGLSHTEKLFSHILNKEKREKLAQQAGFDSQTVDKLASFTDLSRIKWASPTFVVILYEIGFSTVAKIAAADPVDLHKKVNDCNKQNLYFKGAIGLNDIRLFVNAARKVTIEVEF